MNLFEMIKGHNCSYHSETNASYPLVFIDLFLRGVAKLKDDKDGSFICSISLPRSISYLHGCKVTIERKYLFLGLVTYWNHLQVFKGLKEPFTKLVLSLWHHHWIRVDEGKVKTCKINFIFLPSLSKSWDEIPVKWGRIVTPQNFLILGCA
jgi:hypothetical protein